MPDSTTNDTAEDRRPFEAEVSRLLHLMVHSVYSDREVFLRELISNASDALDKLRYNALTEPGLIDAGHEPAITIRIDREERRLIVSDNGIGMSRSELVDNLGTIARSGTAAFLEAMTAAKAGGDMRLIGQFGIGFYASFMVADNVRVISRRAGNDEAYEWESTGSGDYVIRPSERISHGTDIILSLKPDAAEYLERATIERVVRLYSDHIAVPVKLLREGEEETNLNAANALWTRRKPDVADGAYQAFYRSIVHTDDEPLLLIHHHAEGMVAFDALLFVPGHVAGDLYDPARKPRIRLHVRRVFVSDDNEEILPGWLRFLRGVVDSEDLPLNLSREMLQSSPVLRRIRKGLTGKILAEFASLANSDPGRYGTFWSLFGAVLKEGLYEDAERREALLPLVRVRTTLSDEPVSLADYVGRMKPDQSAIWYVTGQNAETVARVPQLEGFRARGIEVLLLSDPIDDFWLSAVGSFDGKPFRSITRGDAGLPEDAQDSDKPQADDAAMAALIALMTETLGEQVAAVRLSRRLTSSPVCLIADEAGLDLQLERMLRQHRALEAIAPRILEINQSHGLIAAMATRVSDMTARAALEDAIHVLHDQARLLAGDAPADNAALCERINRLTEQALTPKD